MPLFETKTKSQRNSTKKRVTGLSATAENRREIAKKIRRETAVFGGCAAVSTTPFHHRYHYHHSIIGQKASINPVGNNYYEISKVLS